MKGSANKPQQPPAPSKKAQIVVKEQPKEWRAQDYVSNTVPIEQVRQIKTAFDIFDADKSGFVDALQLKRAFISLGLNQTNKLVFNVMHNLEGQHPDGLNFAQFLKLATGRLGESHSRKQIQKVFVSFDHQKNGKINAQQFKQVANELGQHLTDQQIEKIFIKTDQDEDGFVTAEDFYCIMTNKTQWQ